MKNTLANFPVMRPLVFIALLCNAVPSLGQESGMPQIIPPSPDASSLGKFGEIPVSPYTGVPNISIPLFDVKVRDIRVPISLSYHASGIRVEEEASWVGLGWALQAGGMVTRTVRGNDDLVQNFSPGFVYSPLIPDEVPVPGSNPPATMLPIPYVEDLCLGAIDAQPDIFQFNFLGYSGKFFLKRKESVNDPVQVMLASDNEKLSITYDEVAGKWTILTKEGFRAEFGTKEYTNSLAGPVPDPNNLPSPLTWEYHEDIITTWYLDKVTSPMGEEVTFEYDIPPIAEKPEYASRSIISLSESKQDLTSVDLALAAPECQDLGIWFFGKKIFPCLGSQNPITAQGNPCAGTASGFSGSMTITWNIYLKRITFKNGEIRFVTDSRDDIEAHYTPTENFTAPRRLKEIQIYSNDAYVKSFHFSQSYFNEETSSDAYVHKRLKLNSVVESSGSISKKPYIFSYIGDNTTASTFLPPKNSAARDHWGLYNGKEGNNTIFNSRPALIPAFSHVASDGIIRNVKGADRNADEQWSMHGVLEKITYPTGGNTRFYYESHQVTEKETAGVETEKSYFAYTNDLFGHSTVFELNQITEVALNAIIKCPTLACYPGGTGTTPCDFTAAMYSEPYVKITNLLTGVVVFKQYYSDYECKFYPQTSCAADVTATFCGVKRSGTLSLDPGRYMINTLPKFGFQPEANVSYQQKQYSNLLSEVAVYKGGGLRIKKIVDHDGLNSSNDVVRRFDYTTKNANGEVLSTGRLMSIPKYQYLEINDLTSGSSSAQCVVIKSTSYSNVPLGSSAQGSPVGYDKVTLIYGEHGENGFSVFEYMNEPDQETQPYLPNSPTINHSASNGLLLAETHYTRDGFKVSEVKNQYVKASTTSLEALYTFSTNGCGAAQNGTTGYKRYKEESEWWQLQTKTESTYDAQDLTNIRHLDVITNISYDPNHKMVSSTHTVNSDGKATRSFNYYPFDLQDPTCALMWDETDPHYKHMHSVLVKRETFVDQIPMIFLSGVKNNYVATPAFNIVQSSVEIAGTDGVYEPRVIFDKFDDWNNLLQVRKSDDIPIAYLWGYDHTLPVAQTTNAQWDQIFYEGFELHISATIDPTLSHSGNRYMLASFHIPFTLPDGNAYKLAYWKFDNGKWVHVDQDYEGPMTITGERLDDIRVFPAGAQMTTYDYEPLTGIITSTDQNNQSTHYSYDEIKRLIQVQDPDRQPVIGYKYQYKN